MNDFTKMIVHCENNDPIEMSNGTMDQDNDNKNNNNNSKENDDEDDRAQDSSSLSSCETVIVYQESKHLTNIRKSINSEKDIDEDKKRNCDHIYRETKFINDGHEQILDVSKLIETSDRLDSSQQGNFSLTLIEIDLNSGDENDHSMNSSSNLAGQNRIKNNQMNRTRSPLSIKNNGPCKSAESRKEKMLRKSDVYHDDCIIEPPLTGLVFSNENSFDFMHQNSNNNDNNFIRNSELAQEQLVCSNQRLKDYFESIKYHSNNESRRLYQFFKSVRTELVASLLFSLITAQALISIRSSKIFRTSILNSHEQDNHKYSMLFPILFQQATTLNEPDQKSLGAHSNIADYWQWDRTSVQITNSLVLALLVASLTQIFGHISGAHLAPAISISLYIKGHIGKARLGAYLGAQAIGSLLGLIILALLTSSQLNVHEAGQLLAPIDQAHKTSEFKQAVWIASKSIESPLKQRRLQRRSIEHNKTEKSEFGEQQIATQGKQKQEENFLITSMNETATMIVIVDSKANQINETINLASKLHVDLGNSTTTTTTATPKHEQEQYEDELIVLPEPKLETLLVSLMDEINLQRDLRNQANFTSPSIVISNKTSLNVPNGRVNTTSTSGQLKQTTTTGQILQISRQLPQTEAKITGHSDLSEHDQLGAIMQPERNFHANFKRILDRRALVNGQTSKALKNLIGNKVEDDNLDEQALHKTGPLKRDLLQTFQAQDGKIEQQQQEQLDKWAKSARDDQSGIEIALESSFQVKQHDENEPFSDYFTINLLALAMPESVMSSSSLSECFATTTTTTRKTTLQTNGPVSSLNSQAAVSKTTTQLNDNNLIIKSSNKSDTRDKVGKETRIDKLDGYFNTSNLVKQHEQLFQACLSRSNGAQMFLLQFLASLLIVLGYLINVDPRRSDAGFRALSIGFVYFVSNLITVGIIVL